MNIVMLKFYFKNMFAHIIFSSFLYRKRKKKTITIFRAACVKTIQDKIYPYFIYSFRFYGFFFANGNSNWTRTNANLKIFHETVF